MPLRANLDGKPVTGPILTDAEWVSLRQTAKQRRESLRLPCCNAKVGLRVSKTGLKHFYHVRRDANGCSYALESEQHLNLKWLIASACRAAGWDASTEVGRSDVVQGEVLDTWRADVLATKTGQQSVCFEVQVSSLAPEEFKNRNQKYLDDGIKCIWIAGPKAVASTELLSKQFPSFALWEDVADVSVRVGDEVLEIGEFVQAVLDQRLTSCSGPSTLLPFLTLQFFVAECWRNQCGSPVGFFRCHATRKFACGEEEFLAGREFREIPAVRSLAAALRVSAQHRDLALGELKPRFSRDLGTELRFGCPKCDVLFGDNFIEPPFGEDPWEDLDQVAQARVQLSELQLQEIDSRFSSDEDEFDEHSHWLVLPKISVPENNAQ